MGTYERLKQDMTQALRDGDRALRETLADMVATIEKASTAGKERVQITDKLAEDTLIKYQKQVKEMLDTCPASRTDLLDKYSEKMKIVMRYAPQVENDPEQIRKAIAQWAKREAPFPSVADFRKYMTSLCKIARHDMRTAMGVINEEAKNYVRGN